MSTITDYNGKIVEWAGTENEALNKGYNIDCSRCSNCSGCLDCLGCSDCSDCLGCSDCLDCSDCSVCSGCSDCLNQPLANIITSPWIITIRSDKSIQIGCQNYSLKEWLSFDEAKLLSFDDKAIDFMKKWKSVILEIVNNN